jgi:hypothetical protein
VVSGELAASGVDAIVAVAQYYGLKCPGGPAFFFPAHIKRVGFS